MTDSSKGLSASRARSARGPSARRGATLGVVEVAAQVPDALVRASADVPGPDGADDLDALAGPGDGDVEAAPAAWRLSGPKFVVILPFSSGP